MDAIKTYLDNVFAAFPQSERVWALKREMLAGMEEKYHALKEEGKSEHEAVGSVIANFGSIDEIAEELGLAQQSIQAAAVAERQETIRLSREEAREYLGQMGASSKWIGGGVWLILTGVAAMMAIDSLGRSESEAIGIFVMLIAIAIAVTVFILNGLRLSRYEHYEKSAIRLDADTRDKMERERAEFKPRLAVQISAGVVLILIAVGMFVFLDTLGYDILPIVLLLFTIGFSVFLFVTAGMINDAYDVILGKGDYRNKARYNKGERLIGTIAAVYWPLTGAIFLLWSFGGNAWDRSWVIWPVAGILFGAIAGGIGAWHNTNTGK